MTRSWIVIAVLAAPGCATYQRSTPQTTFAYRIEEYLEMRRQAVQRIADVPPAVGGSTSAAKHAQLRRQIQRVRRGFHQGIVFSGQVGAEFRRVIASRLSAPVGVSLRRTLDTSTPAGPQPRINDHFSIDQSGEALPPFLLAALPALPSVLVYRSVGRTLVLLDRDAQMVIDMLPEAWPAP